MDKKTKARDYTPSTVKRLHTLSGNECFAPTCDRRLIAADGETVVSKICHIEAASPKGPRYRLAMTDDERRHFNNLILLCDECHQIIDNKANEIKYPVSLLQEWKTTHENKQKNKISLNTSLLTLTINAIASADFEGEQDESYKPFNIESKITYNAIKRNKFLIEEYKVYYAKLATLYKELEQQGSFKKERLLRNVRHLYLKIKGKYSDGAENSIDAIRAHADDIIEEVEGELLAIVDSSNISIENVSFCLSVIMVDAFMRCKIFEEPV
jgi:hypothetical protein